MNETKGYKCAVAEDVVKQMSAEGLIGGGAGEKVQIPAGADLTRPIVTNLEIDIYEGDDGQEPKLCDGYIITPGVTITDGMPCTVIIDNEVEYNGVMNADGADSMDNPIFRLNIDAPNTGALYFYTNVNDGTIRNIEINTYPNKWGYMSSDLRIYFPKYEEVSAYSEIIMKSSTEGSNKIFKMTVDDTGSPTVVAIN
jgi:hypothetical protein